MTKKYAVMRVKIPKPDGSFWEAFRMGLIELGSTGDEFYDEAGYPFPDEVHAFVHDWLNLSGDFQEAMRKVDATRGSHNWAIVGEVHGQGKKRGGPKSTTESSK